MLLQERVDVLSDPKAVLKLLTSPPQKKSKNVAVNVQLWQAFDCMVLFAVSKAFCEP